MMTNNVGSDWLLMNANNRFKRITVPQMFKTHEKINYDVKFENVRRTFMIDTEMHPDRPDVIRRHRVKPGPQTNRLSFPTPKGYTTYKELSTAKFFCDLFNLCSSHGMFEPKLLINHAAFTPWWPSIYPNPEYSFDVQIDDNYCKLFHDFYRAIFLRSKIDDVKIYAHKTTTPGPPFSFANGEYYTKEDFLIGFKTDLDNSISEAMRKDYTKVKQSYFEFFFDIHLKQIELSKVGLVNMTPGQIIRSYNDCSLTTGVKGYRGNSMDTIVNIAKGDIADISNRYYTKDRYFTLFTEYGVVVGLVDNRAVTDYINQYFSYSFAITRNREIFNQNYAAQVSPSVSSRMVLSQIEESVNGFANTSLIVKQGYKDFLTRCYSIGNGEFIFLNGDRTNAETSITTNYEQFEKLVPPEFQKLFRFQNVAIMLDDIPYVFEGLPSGMARTTELNWICGTFEALYTLSYLLDTNIVNVAREYFNSVLNNQSYFIINDKTVVKLFMCTDDIPLILFTTDSRVVKKSKELSKIMSKRLMDWSVSSDFMTTFGMRFDNSNIEANQTSIISKLFYSEHPGFFVKDCFSLYCKTGLIEPELKRDVDKLLLKHYGFDLNYYSYPAKAFLGWLKEFNIPISEAVDVYSPAGKIIYGKFTSKDDILESSRVPAHFFEKIFTDYKSIVKKDNNVFTQI